VRQWEATSGRAIGESLRGHQGGVLSAAYSADGRRIVSAGGDGTVRQWEATSGRAIGEPLRGHQGVVLSAAYSAAGSWIVSAGEDGMVRQWLPAWSQPIGVACRSLRTHQSLLSPTTETQKEAKSTCQRWGWR
jgi:WD40 repeat protein